MKHATSSRGWAARGLVAAAAVALTMTSGSALAGLPAAALVPPPEPAIQPDVYPLTESDRDGNRVDDTIDAAVASARATLAAPSVAAPRLVDAFSALDEPIDVEFNFYRRVTQDEINAFLDAGGEITYMYRATAYGWNGVIPRGRVAEVAAAMGPGFNGAVEAVPAKLHLYNATRNARVRSVWPLGYRGNANITIAILDTGVSESHTDLNGRRVFWHDYTADNLPTPSDKGEHGSHVTGIACGTGAAEGTNPTTFAYSDSNPFPTQDYLNYFNPTIIDLPTPSGGTGAATIKWSAAVKWATAGAGRTAALQLGLWETDDDAATALNDTGYYGFISGASNTTGTFSVAPATAFQSPVVANYNTADGPLKANTSYVLNIMQPTAGTGWGTTTPSNFYNVATTFTAQNGNKFSVGDNYPLFSGVAPLTKWAGFKVFKNDGSGNSDTIGAALDDLVIKAAPNLIKVANMSLGLNSSLSTLRAKANNAVKAGVFVAVSEGNDGPGGTPTDPARAGLVMTVAAGNSRDQLTEYTTDGFANGTDLGGDAIKPDVIAPGGSFYYGYMMSVDSNDADAFNPNFADAKANDYKAINGTSMASPFVAGAAALVIDAWQQTGHVWTFGQASDPMFVKMLLCASATETNQQREFDPSSGTAGTNNPTVGRALTPKDPHEGYGFINVDAAIECLRRSLTSTVSETLGSGRFDKRTSGFNVALTSGQARTITLTVPTGADYDLYLYSPVPGLNGNPQILASATNSTLGGSETLTYTPTATGSYYLLVKRISGAGQFTVAISGGGQAPTVTTGAATAVAAATATLNGTVNPNGGATTDHFDYGLTTAYGSSTANASAGSGTTAVAATANLTGLASGTTYHYRLSGTNPAGTTNGADATFTTKYATADVKTALRLYAGLLKSAADATRLNVVTSSGSTTDVDMLDIVELARKVAGKDANP